MSQAIRLRPTPPDSAFDPAALAQGIRVELEHTPDPEVAKEIAKHHLMEDRDYYAKLAQIHLDGPLGQAPEECSALDIECRAAKGARAAVRPWVIGAVALGVLGALAGTTGVVLAWRNR